MGHKLTRIFGSFASDTFVGFIMASLIFVSFSPAVAQADDQVSFGRLPVSADAAPKRILRLEVSAYTSRPQETDATPFVTASNTRVRDGVVASNSLPIGTRIRIPAAYGDKVFIVEDRMNARYTRNVDIWMDDLVKAKSLGRRQLDVHVF